MAALDSVAPVGLSRTILSGFGPIDASPEMMYRSRQRFGMLMVYLLIPVIATAGFDPPNRNPRMVDFFTVVGLVVLSGFMAFFKPVSPRADIAAHVAFFVLAQIVSGQILQNGMGINQLVPALVAGWCVSYGLFGNGKFEPDAIRFPAVILAALVVSEFDTTLSSIIATFLLIDAFLAVVHSNTEVPGTSIAYIAFAGLVELWIRMSK